MTPDSATQITLSVKTVAEAYLMTLKARGVDELFGNAGTDFAPIIAGLARAEADGLSRIWLVFDGADPAAVQAARTEWTRMTGWGLAAQYWSDETGTWVKKTEKAANP